MQADKVASGDSFAVSSFLLNLLPKRASFDEVPVNTCVVPDSASACFDAVKAVRITTSGKKESVHKTEFD